MNGSVASAVFDDRSEAQRAIEELRSAGVSDSAISVIGRDGDEDSADGGSDGDAGDTARDVVGKTAAGAGLGAILGVAALAIPGVGPLAAAGAIAQSAIGGAALTGTAIGAAAGGLTGILTDHGVSDDDAAYYEGRLGEGGTVVTVQNSGGSSEQIQEILYRNGGHSASRSRTEMA